MQCLVCRVGEAERRLPSINSIGRVKAITDTFGNQVAVDNSRKKRISMVILRLIFLMKMRERVVIKVY
jgi:hypothetical protein